MGRALITNVGYIANPSTTFTAVTMNTGDSATVPSFTPGSYAMLFGVFSPGATKGQARIRSPRFHDAAQAIRLQRGAAVIEPLLPLHLTQPLYPSDALTAEVTGGASETDMLGWQEYFDDLPGVNARLAAYSEIASRIKNILGQEVGPTAGSTAGQYGTARAINADFDTMKANTDYALLGFATDTKCAAAVIKGPDTGNYRVGGPLSITPTYETRRWFVELSERIGKPCIPIINSNNKGNTTIEVADTTASTAPKVSLILAELG
jgi:hypothetical protein